MVHVVAILSIAALCGLWAWLQQNSACDGQGGCGGGRCGGCSQRDSDET